MEVYMKNNNITIFMVQMKNPFGSGYISFETSARPSKNNEDIIALWTIRSKTIMKLSNSQKRLINSVPWESPLSWDHDMFL